MSIQTQRLIITILIIIMFGTAIISSMFAFQRTSTINILIGILIIFIILSLAFYTTHLMKNSSQTEKKLIIKGTAKIEHIQYGKNKTTYELSNDREIIDDIDKTNWNQNENKN